MDATPAKIIITPAESEIEPDFIQTLRVKIPDTTGTAAADPLFKFTYTNTGNAGVLMNALTSANTITTTSNWINYKGIEEGDDVVTVDVTWKRPLDKGGYEDVYLGQVSSAVAVVDDGVQIEPSQAWVCNDDLTLSAKVTVADADPSQLSNEWINTGNQSIMSDGTSEANTIMTRKDEFTYTALSESALDDSVIVTVYKDVGAGIRETVGYGKALLKKPVVSITPDRMRLAPGESFELGCRIEDGADNAVYTYTWSGGSAGILAGRGDSAVYTAGSKSAVDVVTLDVVRDVDGRSCNLFQAEIQIDIIDPSSVLAGVKDLIVKKGETLAIPPGLYEFDTVNIKGTLLLQGKTFIRVVRDQFGFTKPVLGNEPFRVDGGIIKTDIPSGADGHSGKDATLCPDDPAGTTHVAGRNGEHGKNGTSGFNGADLDLEIWGNAYFRSGSGIDLSGTDGGNGGPGGNGGASGSGGDIKVNAAGYNEPKVSLNVSGGSSGSAGTGGDYYTVSGFEKTPARAASGNSGATGMAGTASKLDYDAQYTGELDVSTGSATQGDLVSYQLTARSDVDMAGVKLSLTLPGDLPYQLLIKSHTPGGYTYDNRTWYWDTSIEAGQTKNVDITVDTMYQYSPVTLVATGKIQTPLGSITTDPVETVLAQDDTKYHPGADYFIRA